VRSYQGKKFFSTTINSNERRYGKEKEGERQGGIEDNLTEGTGRGQHQGHSMVKLSTGKGYKCKKKRKGDGGPWLILGKGKKELQG